MYKIILQFNPFIHIYKWYISLAMIMREGILSDGQQTDIINVKPTFLTNLKGNSSIMIILAIDSLASWGFKTHDFILASPSLFWSSLKINWACVCLLWLSGFWEHFGKWFFKFFVPFLLGSALYTISQYLHYRLLFCHFLWSLWNGSNTLLFENSC